MNPEHKQKVDTLLDLGNMTRDESDYVTRLSQILDKGLGLWKREIERLDTIHTERTK